MKKFRLPLLVALLSPFYAVSVFAAPTLTVGTASGQAGTIVGLPITFDPTTASVSGIQFDLALPPAISTVSLATGSNLNSAVKILGTNLCNGFGTGGVCNPPVSGSSNIWRFLIYPSTNSLNQNAIGSGVAVTIQLSIAPGTAAGNLNVQVSGVVYVDPSANAVSAGASVGGTITVFSPCDVNLSGGAGNVGDVQVEVNCILHTIPYTASLDINGNGRCDVGDVQRIVNVILGGACVVGP